MSFLWFDYTFANFEIPTCLDNCACKVSSPYEVFNLVAVANMCVKTPLDLWGGVHPPFGVPRKPPSTHLKNEKF